MTNRILAIAAFVVLPVGNVAAQPSARVVQTDNGGTDDGQIDLAGSITNDVILESVPGVSILTQQLRLLLNS